MPLPTRPFEWLAKASTRAAFWLGAPLLLYGWTLAGPFVFDDLNLLLRAERYARGESARLDLFRFAPTDEAWLELRSRGTLPWWTTEQRYVDYFRPLAEWSFYLDVRLFGRNAFGHRLVSLAWFAITLVLVHRLYSAASQDRVRAGAATFLVGISQAMAQPVSFVSNRSDLLAAAGVSLAAWAYWKASPVRADRPARAAAIALCGWPLVPLAAVGFAFGVLSKEAALPLVAVVMGDMLLARRRREPLENNRAWTTLALPLCALAAAYVSYYLLTRGHVLSSAPGSDATWSMLAKAPLHILLYLAVWTAGFPIGLLLQAPLWASLAVGIASALATFLVGRCLHTSLLSDRAARFFLLWAVFFLLPGLLVLPEARALSVATIGWAFLLAGILAPSHEATAPSAWLRHWLFAVNGAVSLACVLGWVFFANRAENQARASITNYIAASSSPFERGHTLIVAEPDSPLEFICSGDRLEFITGRREVAVSFLTAPGSNARFVREDDHTLLLVATKRSLFDSPMHRLALGPGWRPSIGQRFPLRDFEVEIAEIGDADAVTALRLRFKEPLDSPRLHFYPPGLEAIARGLD